MCCWPFVWVFPSYTHTSPHACFGLPGPTAPVGVWTGADSFETSGSLDGWTTGSMDRPFEQRSGSTPSSNTGPSGAADGTYYVFCETSGFYNMNFDLEKDFANINGGRVLSGISFQYHMYGADMGSVILESGVMGGAAAPIWTQIWSKSGDLGNQWNQALVFAQQSPTMLRFTCVVLTATTNHA